MLLDLLTNNFFLVLFGLIFTAGFVPWITRRWQNRDRELEVRTGLVAEMSECIMTLDVHLKRHARPLRSEPETASKPPELEPFVRQFDVARCVIGTQLEVYFPADSGLTISGYWTRLCELIILFSDASTQENPSATYQRIYTELAEPEVSKKRNNAQTRGARNDNVELSWSGCEELLLAEKRRLISAVSKEWMPPLRTNGARRSGKRGYRITKREMDKQNLRR